MTIRNRRVRFRREKGSRRSAVVVASNEDLLTELLCRLPIKSLLKFECVCKHWLSLITGPHFTRRKHLKSNAVSALYLDSYPDVGVERHYEIVPLDPSLNGVALEHLDFAGDPRGLAIEQSCNGLLLIYRAEEKKYMVYNPTTKQSRTLPPLPPPPFHAGAAMMVRRPVLGFDPSESHFYKVVCIMRSRSRSSDYAIQILIYSSETGSWRVSRAPFNPPLVLGFWNGVYCNGAIHWLGDTDASLYFDLNDEVIREMPMPPPLDGCRRGARYFGESGGRLYLSDSYKDLTTHLNLYEMERDRSGWFLKYRVDPGMLPKLTMPAEGIQERSVLYVGRGEKEEDSFMLLYISNDGDGKIFRYNFLSQTHEELDL